MLLHRVIPCLDVAHGRVVKGTRFVDLRDEGDPAELARRYAEAGADEIVFLDITATHEERGTLLDVVERTARQAFVPLTVGGGVRSVADMRATLRAGADRVSVNTAAVRDPSLVDRCARAFGRQCVVVAIDARAVPETGDGEAPPPDGSGRHGSGRDRRGRWEVVVRGGREGTGIDAVAWAVEAARRGAGELLVTSMDRDGTRHGYDLALLRAITAAVGIPVIASGGAGTPEDLVRAITEGGADAVLAASIFHRDIHGIAAVKDAMAAAGLAVRRAAQAAPAAPFAAAEAAPFAAAEGPSRATSPAPVAPTAAGFDPAAVRWDADGLVPGVVQDRSDGAVRMLGFLDREALDATLRTGLVHFHSRSRGRLWQKGETSGNVLCLAEVRLDCDGDAILLLVDPVGPTCHTGARSCFDAAASAGQVPETERHDDAGGRMQGFAWLEELWATIASRAAERPPGSYTARLLDEGVDAAARKVAEEATEVLLAAKDDAYGERRGAGDGERPPGQLRPTHEPLAAEMADLLYHLLVLAAERGLPPRAVIDVLRHRHASAPGR